MSAFPFSFAATPGRSALVALATLVGSAAVAGGQGMAPGAPADGVAAIAGPAAHVAAGSVLARRASSRIATDGRLDEPAWSTALEVTTFTQIDPTEGAPASQPTRVRILFDDDALYVGAELRDAHPVSLRLARRDANFNDSDVFAIALDSYHDHQTAFRFSVNASGVKRDEVITSTGGGNGDTSWDPVWEATTLVTDSGWVAELRIPFSQLRFGRDALQTWGIQLERRIARLQEYDVYAFTPKKQRGGPPRFAHLEGVRHGAGGHKLELLPYSVGRAAYRAVPTAAGVTFANPFRHHADYERGVGADLKYRVSSNFTLDGTVNPDFGQVEVDPAQINLSAFETRYEEKRPFFVEGAEIFRFGSSLARESQLLYSRRIGRAPQGSVPSGAVYADVPETATILGAAKLTGKTGGWSAGVLEAVTGSADAPWVDAAEADHRARVEPLTSYFVGRVRHSTPTGGTSIGALVTGVERALADDALATRLRRRAWVGGADFRHEWGNRDYSMAGQIVGSALRGRADAITSAQRSSARYFQRPDADYLDVDSAATRLGGYSAFFALGKFAGTWQRYVTLAATSPGFEINDLGFQSSADRLAMDVDLSYHQNVPGRVLRRWEASVSPEATWNYGGDRIGGGLSAHVGGTHRSYWNGNLNVSVRPASLDDRLTRGGPLAARPSEQSVGAFVSSNPRRAVTLNVQGNASRDGAGGWSRRGEITATVKPASNVELRVGPELSRSRNASQYVTSIGDALASTYGRRYVFATLDQTTLSMDTRVNVAFSPRMTLEVYAQPFLSTGDYEHLSELRAARGRTLDEFGRDVGTLQRESDGAYTIDPDGAGAAPSFRVSDRDFSFRSFRSNAVLRWEWHQGSTLFLVWQQNRAASLAVTGDAALDARVGRLDAYRDARELFGIRPDNVLQVKLTYWLNP